MTERLTLSIPVVPPPHLCNNSLTQYGGVFAYPSDKLDKPQGNLQLLYKSAPLAFVLHHAGGKAMDESGADLLDKCPERIHQKSPCFMGSPKDMDELKKYLEKLK